jgi:hypothetical protein
MRTLTLGLIDGSARSIEDGGERSFAIFGEKGVERFVLLRASPLDSSS